MPKSHTISDLNRLHFNQEAHDYDASIFIKDRVYKEKLGLIASILEAAGIERGPVLEIGVGTGSLAALLLGRFPNLQFEGCDISEGMLQQARHKLRGFGERAKLYHKDVARELPSSRFQAVVSTSTVHHLSRQAQRQFFPRVYSLLEPGGFLVLADRFKTGTEVLEQLYDNLNRRGLEAQGLDLSEYDEEMDHAHHTGSQTSPYSLYINRMKRARFVNIDLVWKHLTQGLFYAQKPS